MRELALAFAMILGAACAPNNAALRPETLHGSVHFEARQPTPRGASKGTRLYPAFQARLEALDASGEVVGRGFVGRDGHFSIATRGAAKLLRVRAEATLSRQSNYAVTSDESGESVHMASVPLGKHRTEVVFYDESNRRMAGALHVLYALVAGATDAERWSGLELPSLFVHWQPGETAQWSYYWGEKPLGSGRHKVELLAANQDVRSHEDTDEHDEAIVLHEFAHFVFREWSTDSSNGGYHPVGHLVEPGLAWEEGRASWFASVVRRSSLYTDTVGLEPFGSLRLNYDFEKRGDTDYIMSEGSEPAVAAVLWDLSDGAEGIRDDDFDGIALGPSTLLRAMIELKSKDGAFPSLSGFLQYLVASNRVTHTRLSSYLKRKGFKENLLGAEWPKAIAHGQTLRGRIDGVTNPAPSGGPPYPSSGLDAVNVYKTTISEPGWLECVLNVRGSGTNRSRTNLDIEVRELGGDAFVTSATQRGREVVRVPVKPGHRLIYVRDHGYGNRADYALTMRFRPAKKKSRS